MASRKSLVAVCHPQWRGIRTATYAARVPVVEVGDAGRWAEPLVAEMVSAGVRVLVVQGFPPGADRLLEVAVRNGIATRCVLHSSLAQHGSEPGEATTASEVLTLLQARVIGRLGFAKDGLAEAFIAIGYPATYVPNRVPRLPEFERIDLGAHRLNVGVFAEPFWRKNVVTQLGAVGLMDNARAHVTTRPAVDYFGNLEIVEHGTLRWEEFVQLQGSVDLNLYVTLSECQPLAPMESYAAGVPCLFSRTSALFRDDRDLWDLSTIDELDNPRAIADAARRLLEQEAEAIQSARDWMVQWDRYAAKLWDEFVET